MAPTDKKPSYFQLAKKHYGNGQRYRENVKKGIQRLRRQLEETTRRAARIQKLLAP